MFNLFKKHEKVKKINSFVVRNTFFITFTYGNLSNGKWYLEMENKCPVGLLLLIQTNPFVEEGITNYILDTEEQCIEFIKTTSDKIKENAKKYYKEMLNRKSSINNIEDCEYAENYFDIFVDHFKGELNV